MEDYIINENPSFYAVLTANVRYDQRLTPLERLLYAEITSLTQKNGFCWASNKYFAKLFKKNDKYVSAMINNLIKLNYLKSFVDKDSGNKRKLWLCDLSLSKKNFDNSLDSFIDTSEDLSLINQTPVNNIVNTSLDFSEQITKDIIKFNKKYNKDFINLIYENFEDEKIINLLLDFIDNRKVNKRPITLRGLDLLIKKLLNLSSDKNNKVGYICSLLEESILHSWNTVYPLKDFTDSSKDFKSVEIVKPSLSDFDIKNLEELI